MRRKELPILQCEPYVLFHFLFTWDKTQVENNLQSLDILILVIWTLLQLQTSRCFLDYLHLTLLGCSCRLMYGIAQVRCNVCHSPTKH